MRPEEYAPTAGALPGELAPAPVGVAVDLKPGCFLPAVVEDQARHADQVSAESLERTPAPFSGCGHFTAHLFRRELAIRPVHTQVVGSCRRASEWRVEVDCQIDVTGQLLRSRLQPRSGRRVGACKSAFSDKLFRLSWIRFVVDASTGPPDYSVKHNGFFGIPVAGADARTDPKLIPGLQLFFEEVKLALATSRCKIVTVDITREASFSMNEQAWASQLLESGRAVS